MKTTERAANIFEIQNKPGYCVIRFFGFIDASTVEKTRTALQAGLPASCPNIVVDMAQVNFLDSHGVGLFVSLLKRVHVRGGKLVVVGAEGQPASVLQMVGLNNALVTYCKDANEAAAMFEQPVKGFGI